MQELSARGMLEEIWALQGKLALMTPSRGRPDERVGQLDYDGVVGVTHEEFRLGPEDGGLPAAW